jgi:hypothetical protein
MSARKKIGRQAKALPVDPRRERVLAEQNDRLRKVVYAAIQGSPIFKGHLAARIRETRDASFEVKEACAKDMAKKLSRMHAWRSGEAVSDNLLFGMLYFLMYGDSV